MNRVKHLKIFSLLVLITLFFNNCKKKGESSLEPSFVQPIYKTKTIETRVDLEQPVTTTYSYNANNMIAQIVSKGDTEIYEYAGNKVIHTSKPDIGSATSTPGICFLGGRTKTLKGL